MDSFAVTISSPKGGVGKTMTTFALALGAAFRGRAVAVLDLDPRAQLSTCLLHSASGPTIVDVLLGRTSIGDTLRTWELKGCPAPKIMLGSARLEVAGAPTHEFVNLVHQLRDMVDVILIDSAPHRPHMVPAVLGADLIVIPTTLDVNAVRMGAETVCLAYRLGVANHIGGVVVTNARRGSDQQPVTTHERHVYGGLLPGFLAYDTVLWQAGGWPYSLANGAPVERRFFEQGARLFDEIVARGQADPMAVRGYADVVAALDRAKEGTNTGDTR